MKFQLKVIFRVSIFYCYLYLERNYFDDLNYLNEQFEDFLGTKVTYCSILTKN